MLEIKFSEGSDDGGMGWWENCCVGNILAIEMSESFVWLCILSALYISCRSRITDASPTVSLKNIISIVDVRIIRSNGIARRSLPNLVGCRWYRCLT